MIARVEIMITRVGTPTAQSFHMARDFNMARSINMARTEVMITRVEIVIATSSVKDFDMARDPNMATNTIMGEICN